MTTTRPFLSICDRACQNTDDDDDDDKKLTETRNWHTHTHRQRPGDYLQRICRVQLSSFQQLVHHLWRPAMHHCLHPQPVPRYFWNTYLARNQNSLPVNLIFANNNNNNCGRNWHPWPPQRICCKLCKWGGSPVDFFIWTSEHVTCKQKVLFYRH